MNSSTKLSKNHRKLIKSKLIGARFDRRKQEVKEQTEALAVKVYDLRFEQAMQNRMLALPYGWLPRVKKIKARLAGTDVLLLLPSDRPVPFEQHYYHGESNHLVNLDEPHPLAHLYKAILDTNRCIETEEKKLGTEIDAVLHSVTTSSRLIAIWPEIKDVVEGVCQTCDTSTLPAPRVAHLNQALGLVAQHG